MFKVCEKCIFGKTQEVPFKPWPSVFLERVVREFCF